MENERELEQLEPEREGYVPRPKWQVWGARAATVIFIILIIVQLISIARGGL